LRLFAALLIEVNLFYSLLFACDPFLHSLTCILCARDGPCCLFSPLMAKEHTDLQITHSSRFPPIASSPTTAPVFPASPRPLLQRSYFSPGPSSPLHPRRTTPPTELVIFFFLTLVRSRTFFQRELHFMSEHLFCLPRSSSFPLRRDVEGCIAFLRCVPGLFLHCNVLPFFFRVFAPFHLGLFRSRPLLVLFSLNLRFFFCVLVLFFP